AGSDPDIEVFKESEKNPVVRIVWRRMVRQAPLPGITPDTEQVSVELYSYKVGKTEPNKVPTAGGGGGGGNIPTEGPGEPAKPVAHAEEEPPGGGGGGGREGGGGAGKGFGNVGIGTGGIGDGRGRQGQGIG